MRQSGGKQGERCEERGKKREGEGEEMSYHASIHVGVQLYWAQVQTRQEWLHIFLQQSIYNTKSHRNSTFNTQILQHKKVHTLEYKLIFRVVCESCSDFKEKFLSSRTKSHLQQAVTLWIDIDKALSGNINPLYTLFHPSLVFMVSVILFLLVKVFFQTTNLCQTYFGKHFTWRAAFWKVFIFGLFSFLCLHLFWTQTIFTWCW